MPVDGLVDLMTFFKEQFLVPDSRVIDVGAGGNLGSIIFSKCQVTALDIKPIRAPLTIHKNAMDYKPEQQFDGLWCSHLLEHILNINLFLRHIFEFVKEESPIGIVVPPRKDPLVGGHINLFTAGTLCYNIILAGQNLSKAVCLCHKYNIGIFWKKKSIELPKLKFDAGDIETLSNFFPKEVKQGCSGMVGWERVNSDDFS